MVSEPLPTRGIAKAAMLQAAMPSIRSAAPRFRLAPTARSLAPPVLSAAAAIRAHQITQRQAQSTGRQPTAPDVGHLQPRPNPYVDYVRRYTAQGGIALTYKDVDDRLWVRFCRIMRWLAATAAAYGFVVYLTPLASPLLNALGLLAIGVVNWLIVRQPIELYRHIEIRPDCMIIEEAEVFWRDQMELGFPSFRPTQDGHQMLCGVYGTRWIEYLTIRRFDENDRAPEVFSAHLQAAMRQQWAALGRGSA